MSTYTVQMQRVVDEYMKADQPWPATSRQIAAWAIRNRRWAPHPSRLISQCADELAKAMREEYIVDPQGRSVRAKHAARLQKDGAQLTLWADIRTATTEHMQVAFQQRRQQIVGECSQLKQDVDSFNENRSPIRPIQIVFDFRADLAELDVA